MSDPNANVPVGTIADFNGQPKTVLRDYDTAVIPAVQLTLKGIAELRERLDDAERDILAYQASVGERWGVFVRVAGDPDDDWEERFRWVNGDPAPLADQEAAEARAELARRLHPDWEVEARQTSDPFPGSFEEAFAALLPGTGEEDG